MFRPVVIRSDADAREAVLQVEAYYRIASKRRLTNAEASGLADISAALAVRARDEFAVRVPEFAPRGQIAAVW